MSFIEKGKSVISRDVYRSFYKWYIHVNLCTPPLIPHIPPTSHKQRVLGNFVATMYTAKYNYDLKHISLPLKVK